MVVEKTGLSPKIDNQVGSPTPSRVESSEEGESRVKLEKEIQVTEPPITTRKVKIATEQSVSKLILSLRKKDTKIDIKALKLKLSDLGLTDKTKELSDDFSKKLFESNEFTPQEKKQIIDYFKPDFDAHFSREAIEKEVNTYRETQNHKTAKDPQQDLAQFQERLTANAFEHGIFILLIDVMVVHEADQNVMRLIMDNKTSILEKLSHAKLSTTATGAEAQLVVIEKIQSLFQEPEYDVFISQFAEKVANLYVETQKLEGAVLQKLPEKPMDPATQKTRDAELKKLFSDTEVLKLMTFLQSDKTDADMKILTFSKLKINKKAMKQMTQSQEYKDFIAEMENVIFDPALKNKFSLAVDSLNKAPTNKARQALFKKEMKKLRVDMLKNLKLALTDIQQKTDLGRPVDSKYQTLATKLEAMLKVKGAEKIASQDVFKIIMKRIGIAIGIAIAAAIVGLSIAYILPLFMAATTAAIVGYCVIAGLALLGFSIGISGNRQLHEMFSKFLGLWQGSIPDLAPSIE